MKRHHPDRNHDILIQTEQERIDEGHGICGHCGHPIIIHDKKHGCTAMMIDDAENGIEHKCDCKLGVE